MASWFQEVLNFTVCGRLTEGGGGGVDVVYLATLFGYGGVILSGGIAALWVTNT